jgi:hypothetical protein
MKTQIRPLLKKIWSAMMPTSSAINSATGQSEHQNSNAPPVPVPAPAAPTEIKSLAELIEEKWRAEGMEQARRGKSNKPEAAVEKSLAERAATVTRVAVPPTFDPTSYEVDQRIKMRLSRLDEDEAGLEELLDISGGHVRLREEQRAKIGHEGALPSATDVLRGVTTAVLTLSFAPTIHDFLGPMFAPLKWMLAAGFGAAIGLFIAHAILPDNDPGAAGEERGIGAAAAGAMLGAGFLLVRIAGAHGFSDYVFGLGMALVELGAVVFLEYKARAILAARKPWLANREARETADALITAAQNEHRRLEERRDAKKLEATGIENEHLRGRVFTNADAMAALAAASAVDSYRAEIRANRTGNIVPQEGK